MLSPSRPGCQRAQIQMVSQLEPEWPSSAKFGRSSWRPNRPLPIHNRSFNRLDADSFARPSGTDVAGALYSHEILT